MTVSSDEAFDKVEDRVAFGGTPLLPVTRKPVRTRILPGDLEKRPVRKPSVRVREPSGLGREAEMLKPAPETQDVIIAFALNHHPERLSST